MVRKSDREAAKAHRARLKKQAVYSAKDRDRVAEAGVPQRDHVAAAVLHAVFEQWKLRCPEAKQLLGDALNLLEGDGYDRTATAARMKAMACQPRRKLTPPKPKECDGSK